MLDSYKYVFCFLSFLFRLIFVFFLSFFLCSFRVFVFVLSFLCCCCFCCIYLFSFFLVMLTQKILRWNKSFVETINVDVSELLLLLPIVCPLTYFERERHFCFIIKYFTLIARIIDVTSESDFRFCHLRGSSLPLRRLREISVCWHYGRVCSYRWRTSKYFHSSQQQKQQTAEFFTGRAPAWA